MLERKQSPALILLWIAAFLLLRIGISVALYLICGGHEFSDDMRHHIYYIQNPLCILFADPQAPYSYSPPLLPLLMSIFPSISFALGVPDFLALRSGPILLETIAFALYCCYCQRGESQRQSTWKRLVWLLCPAAIMTSAVMSQDEMTSVLFSVIIAIFILRNQALWSGIAIGLAIVSSKIFFMIIAGSSILGYGVRNLRVAIFRAVPIVAVLAVVYAVFFTAVWIRDSAMTNPVMPLGLSTSMSSVLQMQTSLPDSTLRTLSQLTGLLAGLIPPALLWITNRRPDTTGILALIVAMVSWVLLLFYNLQPEFLVFLIPFILIVDNGWRAALWCWLVLGLSWGVNILYSARYYGGSTHPVKAPLANTITDYSPFSLDVLFQIAVVINTLGLIALAVNYTWKALANARPAGAAHQGA